MKVHGGDGQGYESHERLSHCKHACNRDSSRLTWLRIPSPWFPACLPMLNDAGALQLQDNRSLAA